MSGSDALNGRLDETRLEAVARSAAWFDTTGNNGTAAGFVTSGAAVSGTWFDQGAWSYRKPLVVDGARLQGTVTGFPLLVQMTDSDLAADALASGDDIVFTAADGVTRLAHMTRGVEPGNGGGHRMGPGAHPRQRGQRDHLRLLRQSHGDRSGQDPRTVFGPDYDGVWHLGD